MAVWRRRMEVFNRKLDQMKADSPETSGTNKPFTKTKMSFNRVGRQNGGCEQGSRNQRGETGHEKQMEQMETSSKSSSKWILRDSAGRVEEVFWKSERKALARRKRV